MKIHPSIIDVFCCLLVVFMMASLMAADYYRKDQQERTLPAIDLSEMETDTSEGVTVPDYVTVTVKEKDDLFLQDERVSLAELGRRIAASLPQEVCLRVDDAVPHGRVMVVVRQLRENGVHLISFAYKVKDA